MHTASALINPCRIGESVPDKLNLTKTKLCEACMKGKLPRVPFNGRFKPTAVPPEIIHGDLDGRISPPTNGGALTLGDQFTGENRKDILKVTNSIEEFRIFLEKQTGSSTKKLTKSRVLPLELILKMRLNVKFSRMFGRVNSLPSRRSRRRTWISVEEEEHAISKLKRKNV
ncbi:hypothetical protein PTTG_27593 [Puccinia triticina 1-1 BBBD Race 1]|uniref:Uncharacterized protein n=1 Tax=Puccinia triticina (isolate 1-1 / race 1 (BBBD)) TaxID=630390 RepID=A0A180GIL0_PUCT1|nr:hypothetical protein PTTG_27593 [Puccinia triticina 1-1 BBBD Race 1]